MPETFIDRRRNHLREVMEQYGPVDEQKLERFTRIWIDQRLTQKEIEMILTSDAGAQSEDLAFQFGFSDPSHARAALTRAHDKAGLPRARPSRYDK